VRLSLLVILVSFALSVLVNPCVFAAEPDHSILGIHGADARSEGDARIQVDKDLEALRQSGANTYFYMVWQNEHDWEDLPAFADGAAKMGVNVWVYIVPWSETPPDKIKGWGFSEPYRNDYVRWAREIARFSLQHKNIVGFVIDDFFENVDQPGRFSPEYVKQMLHAAHQVNPNLKFYPLLYFQMRWADFMQRYSSLCDGVVICYPKSEAAVRNALTYLRGKAHGPGVMFELTRKTPAQEGDGAMVAAEVPVLDASEAELSFYFDGTDARDDPTQPIARVRVNGHVVWEASTQSPPTDGVVTLDLSRQVHGSRDARIEFSLTARRFGTPDSMRVVARFDDIRLYGFGTPGRGRESSRRYPIALKFRALHTGKFQVTELPGGVSGGKTDLPVILMPAGEPVSHEKRHLEKATPEKVRDNIRMCLDLLHEKLVEGVVPYRVPMDPSDPYFQMIRHEYARFHGSPLVESPARRQDTPPRDTPKKEAQPGHLRTLQPGS
jgi:hypothetical protein